MLGASQAVVLGAASAAVTYDSLVAIFGPDVVSYWKFESDGTDEKGSQNASIIGSPELNVDTIVDLDTIIEGAPVDGKCIAWPGTAGVYAEAAHNPAHKTAQGAIVATFQRDSAMGKAILLAADANNAAGGLSMEVTAVGEPRAFLRRQSDGAPVVLLGQPGDVALNNAYTLILKWGPGGLEMALWDENSNVIRRVTNPLTDGVTGSSPIRFGAWHSGVDPHDGPYGRVVWLNRRITTGEEIVLARARTIAHGPLPGEITQLGAWPLSEMSANTFADSFGGNTASLMVPSWTVATHENNRPGIVAGSDHALEVSNGGPAIPMVAGYKQAAMSLVLYVEPRGELRGVQYWNTADERYGREFTAHCDNGSTPGSFAIYRRRFSATEWRLGGYVRDGAGTKQYFGGSLSGISGATLPVDTAKRIVLTQGPAGATLYLDNAQVASLPSVTQGWLSLSTPITLGSSSSTGHANDRSPLWGRLDQIEVWQGQMALANVQARAAATQSKLWRYPSDFVGGSTDINIANFTNNGSAPQAAMNAAAAAGRYVYQAEGDATWYTASDQGGDNAVVFKPGCKGFINVKMVRPSNQNGQFDRLINASSSAAMGTSHGDPFAGSGGWKFIGCQFDSNARGQSWHPKSGEPGYTHHAFDLQHAHIFFAMNTSVNQTWTFDACDFMDTTGDGLSLDQKQIATIKSCRFWGCFRGSLVCSQLGTTVTERRCEIFAKSRSGFGSLNQGSGLTDLETNFGGSGSTHLTTRDVWCEGGDWDEFNGSGANMLYVNTHLIGSAVFVSPQGVNGASNSWEARYCTISYHRPGGNGTGYYPPGVFRGFPVMGGTGCLFDHCVFVASGDQYNYHESWIVTPGNSLRFFMRYESQGTQSRLFTLRDCEFRAKNLPGGLATSNVQAIDMDTLSTSQSIELDGVIIDSAFADLPFEMGGITVRYRNVLHQRTGNTKPWSGAGAEVPL